jgi:hypothetical protein
MLAPRYWSNLQLFLGYFLAALICLAYGAFFWFLGIHSRDYHHPVLLAILVFVAVITCELAWAVLDRMVWQRAPAPQPERRVAEAY